MPEGRPRNPYDFVPLEGNPQSRNGLGDNTQEAVKASLHSGRLVCRLTTETPLYIHGEGAQQAQGQRPFFRAGGRLCIPASALKGMVRSIAEIVADGCLSTLSERAARPQAVPPGYGPCDQVDTCCPICALFGMVETREASGEGQATPLAGRVAFSPALPVGSVRTVPVRMPGPRGGPKPAHRSFYFDPGTGKVLGRKLYYHHGNRYRDSLRQAFDDLGKYAQPITLEAVEGDFAFEVRFENLTDRELGVLVYSLALEDDLRHHLGFAKPYGLGTVRITIETFELVAFGGLPGGGKAPARFLSYDDAGTTRPGDGAYWQAQGLRDWKARPNHAAAYTRFKEILHWPRHEIFAYPTFQWFKGQRGARVKVTLDQYQGRAAPTTPTPTPTAGRRQGIVERFDRGWGFIRADDGERIFVHHTNIRGTGFRTLYRGERVEFDVEIGPKGPRAVDVVRLEGGKP